MGRHKNSKTLEESDDSENKKFKINSRAVYILVFAMDMNECNRISQCKMAKEVWRILEMTYEGTSKVKDSKVRIHVN